MRIKHIIGYTAALAVGGAIGYRVAYKKASNEFMEQFDREMDIAHRQMLKSAGIEVLEEDDIIENGEPKRIMGDPSKVTPNQEDRVPYELFSASDATNTAKKILNNLYSTEDEDVKLELAEAVEGIENVEFVPAEPVSAFGHQHIMTQEEFYSEGMDDINLHELDYYTDDGILTDGLDSVDIEYTIGSLALDSFEDGPSGTVSDIIYVHNSKINARYVVTRIWSSYKSSVLGLSD